MAKGSPDLKPILLYGCVNNRPQQEFAEKILIKKYSGLFAKGTRMKELMTEIAVEDLLKNWQLMQEKTIEILSSLDDDHLVKEICQTPRHHPFVKTKLDSLSWNIKHTMWHCGQIGMLRRVIDKSFDFGM